MFQGEVALQFTLQVASYYTTGELVELAGLASRLGFDQIWLSDALRYRNPLVVATAIASKVSIKLGTAILVPYFRNPIDVADSLLALSELMPGKEISLGIAKGSKGQVPQYVRMFKPFRMVTETVLFMKRLLAGERVRFHDYPTLCAYYHLNENGYLELISRPRAPVLFYGGGVGPRFLAIAGEAMDGVLIGGYFITMVKLGRLETALAGADEAARSADPRKRLRKVCELNVAVSKEPGLALAEAKKYAAHHMVSLEALGYTPEEFGRLGIDYGRVERLRETLHSGTTIEEASRQIVTDAMVKACFVAGAPSDCVEPILELAAEAARLGFGQISFAKLGQDYSETIEFLSKEIVPRLR